MSKEILIIMPIYNNKSLLKEALSSLIYQSYKDFTICIIDDNSEEDLSSVIKNYKTDLDIIYIKNKEQIGPGQSRQKGLEYAYKKKYSYILFMDSDDLFMPNAIKRLYYEISSNNLDVVYSCIITEQKEPERPDTYMDIFMGSTWLHGKIYRTKFLKTNDIHFFPELMVHEDLAFNIVTQSIPGMKIKTIEDKLYYYRENYNSLTHNPNNLYDKHKDSTTTHIEAIYRSVKYILDHKYNLLEDVVVAFLLTYNDYQLLLLRDKNMLVELNLLLDDILTSQEIRIAFTNFKIWETILTEVKSFTLTGENCDEDVGWNYLRFYPQSFGQWLEAHGVQLQAIIPPGSVNRSYELSSRISNLLF